MVNPLITDVAIDVVSLLLLVGALHQQTLSDHHSASSFAVSCILMSD